MQTVTTIGLDIAKSVFQVHGVDAASQVVIRRKLHGTHVHSGGAVHSIKTGLIHRSKIARSMAGAVRRAAREQAASFRRCPGHAKRRLTGNRAR